MYTQAELDEYLAEIRKHVCSRCIERPPGGPPCAPRRKQCGIELNLPRLVQAVHEQKSRSMDVYIEHFQTEVCTYCANRITNQCPCPLKYLLLLAVEAIETVDDRRQMRGRMGLVGRIPWFAVN